MKYDKIILVSIFLLAIISLSAASAADDMAANDIAAEEGDLDLELSASDEIISDGDNSQNLAISAPSADEIDDVAVGDNVSDVKSDDKLGASADDVIADKVAPKSDLTFDLPMSGSAYVAQWGQTIVAHGSFQNATGNVTITFAGETYKTQLVDGAFTYEVTKYTKVSNNQVFKVTYEGDDNYKSTSIQKNIHIQLNDVVATGSDYGQISFITVNLYNATGNVTFTFNGKTYKQALANGTAIQEFTNYTLGKNSVSFAYEGDDKFNQITKSLSFTTTAKIDAPTIYNFQPAIITAYLGEATGKVNFTFGNATQIVDIVNGVATFEAVDYVIGENTVSVSYSGDDTFNAFETTQKFTVLDKENATILSSVYKTANKNMVVIYIPYGTGSVNATINGKKEVLELVDGIVYYNISESDVITEINVTYAGNARLNPADSSKFLNLNNVVNQESYVYYFNQANNGKLFDFIEDGTTLDFQGSIINPNQKNNVFLYVSKPVNIISTTGDAYVDLNTTAGSLLGESPGNSFAVGPGGSGSNITGIDFHNTQLWISNTTNVVFDDISNVVEDQRVGSGVGATSVRDNSSYVTIKNSYFYTRNNGGSTTFTFSWAHHCIFDNNTVKAEGNVGNLLYLNVYNIANAPSGVPLNTYNTFSNNKVYGKEGSAISVGIMVEGVGNLIANNSMFKCSISTSFGGVNPSDNIYAGNILMEGSGLTAQAKSIVYDNIVPGTFSTGANSVVYNNTVGKAMTVGAGTEVYNNTVGGFTLSGAGAYVHDNTVNGATTISQANTVVANNTFLGDNSIKFSNANAKNVTFADNDVVGYIEFANTNAKGNVILGNKITTSKDSAIDLKTYTGTETVITDNILSSKNGFGDEAINHKDDATLVIDNYQNETVSISVVTSNIKVGQTAVFNVTTNQTAITSADVVVNGKSYPVSLVNGKGSVEVAGLLSGTYEVIVTSNDLVYGARNTTTITVAKNNCPEIVVVVPEKTQWIACDITVTINDATGSVTLSVNGTDVTANLVDGVAVLAIPDLSFGEYNYTITYAGDYKYLTNKTNGTLTVVKNKEAKILAEDVVAYIVANEFAAKFTNYIGEAIPNANVTITIGNATYPKVTDENGTVNVALMLFRGQYDVTVEFKAIPDEFDAATAKYTIRVIGDSIMDIVSVDGEGIIIGSLSDAMGAPIANAKVIAKINGTNTTLTTDNDGQFQFQAQNGYPVVFTFEGDNITALSEASITLNNVAHVLKEAIIDVSDVKVVAVDTAAGEKGKAYKFTLKDAQGNAIANKTVKAVLNGNMYDVATDANGTASITISINAAKTYSLDVFFIGDNDYKGATATAKVTVTKKSSTLKAAKTKYTFKAKAKSKVIKATLKTSNKYLKAGKKVTIKIKGKTYTAKTGKKGAIKINLKSLKKKGTYKAKIKFAGDSTYKASSSKTIKIVIK